MSKQKHANQLASLDKDEMILTRYIVTRYKCWYPMKKWKLNTYIYTVEWVENQNFWNLLVGFDKKVVNV